MGKPKQLCALMSRFRYPILILIVGLMLMLLPTGDEVPEVLPAPTVREASLETQLETILSQIEGAGRVRVLLTMDAGRETQYQTDGDSRDTVLVEGADREERGLVRQTLEPKYRGAVVVCQGAGNPSVKLAIVEAVSCVTGLGADQISVLKLQNQEALS